MLNFKDKKVLIVIAHPDDEVLYFGNLLLELRNSQTEIIIALVTKVKDSFLSNLEREERFKDVCKNIGAKYTFLKYNQSVTYPYKHKYYNKRNSIYLNIKNYDSLCNDIVKLFFTFKPDFIFTHNTFGDPNNVYGYEGHPDHRYISHCVVKSFFNSNMHLNCKLYIETTCLSYINLNYFDFMIEYNTEKKKLLEYYKPWDGSIYMDFNSISEKFILVNENKINPTIIKKILIKNIYEIEDNKFYLTNNIELDNEKLKKNCILTLFDKLEEELIDIDQLFKYCFIITDNDNLFNYIKKIPKFNDKIYYCNYNNLEKYINQILNLNYNIIDNSYVSCYSDIIDEYIIYGRNDYYKFSNYYLNNNLINSFEIKSNSCFGFSPKNIPVNNGRYKLSFYCRGINGPTKIKIYTGIEWKTIKNNITKDFNFFELEMTNYEFDNNSKFRITVDSDNGIFEIYNIKFHRFEEIDIISEDEMNKYKTYYNLKPYFGINDEIYKITNFQFKLFLFQNKVYLIHTQNNNNLPTLFYSKFPYLKIEKEIQDRIGDKNLLNHLLYKYNKEICCKFFWFLRLDTNFNSYLYNKTIKTATKYRHKRLPCIKAYNKFSEKYESKICVFKINSGIKNFFCKSYNLLKEKHHENAETLFTNHINVLLILLVDNEYLFKIFQKINCIKSKKIKLNNIKNVNNSMLYVSKLPEEFETVFDLKKNNLIIYQGNIKIKNELFTTSHKEISIKGNGLFSHWKTNIYFSYIDNTNKDIFVSMKRNYDILILDSKKNVKIDKYDCNYTDDIFDIEKISDCKILCVKKNNDFKQLYDFLEKIFNIFIFFYDEDKFLSTNYTFEYILENYYNLDNHNDDYIYDYIKANAYLIDNNKNACLYNLSSNKKKNIDYGIFMNIEIIKYLYENNFKSYNACYSNVYGCYKYKLFEEYYY